MASLTISRVPSTLIRRASSSGSVKLIEAAQWTTAETEPASCSRMNGDSPSPGVSRSAASARTRPRRGRALGRHERRQQLVDARLRGAIVGGPHERDDVAVGVLEHAGEQLHPDEAGRTGQQQRAGAHAACRHSVALWPPKPKEFDSATGGRPFAISSGRAVPGT